MFAGFTETFLKNGGQLFLYQYTKSDRNNRDKCRDISLFSTGYKIYSKLITKRLTVIADVLLLEEQNGVQER